MHQNHLYFITYNKNISTSMLRGNPRTASEAVTYAARQRSMHIISIIKDSHNPDTWICFIYA